ncbi:hypothetical protein [Dyella tabacisoli]|nr:hypothetical protein [Dyella tabacisoli]
MTLTTAPTQTGTEIFERILAAPGSLVALEGGDTEVLIDQLRVLVRHTGQSVYLWQPEIGLDSLRDAHARVPGSQRLSQVLRLVQQSIHFGVYLLRGVQLPLPATDLSLLRQLARVQKGHVRRVVLLDAPTALVDSLNDVIARVSCAIKPELRPRLRDGRWLL